MAQGRNDVEARGRISEEVCLKQPPNLPAATDEVQPFQHTHGSRGGGLTHLQQMLPTQDRPALFPAPGWQQWFFWTSLPLDQAIEAAYGEKSLPFLQQPPAKKQVLLPAPLPGEARAALTIGYKPSPLARAGAFPSRVASQQTCCWPWRGSRATPVCRHYPSLPGQDLAVHPSWRVAHFLPAGGEGVPEPGSSSQAARERKPAARLAALGKI